jgi:hypothetical protein
VNECKPLDEGSRHDRGGALLCLKSSGAGGVTVSPFFVERRDSNNDSVVVSGARWWVVAATRFAFSFVNVVDGGPGSDAGALPWWY